MAKKGFTRKKKPTTFLKELFVLVEERRQKSAKQREKCMHICVYVRLCACMCVYVFIACDIVQGQSYLSRLKCDFLCRNGYMRKIISEPNLHTLLSGDNSLPALLSHSNSQSFLVHHADKTLTIAQTY